VNVYVVLLRRMDGSAKRTASVPLEPNILTRLAQSTDVQLLDIVACVGIFDAVLLCRAEDNPTIARLLDSLEGWHTDAMLATSHMRYETASDSGPGSTSTVLH
jgi:hypothetical protein